MVQDEGATVATLKEYRAALQRLVERHKGRVVNAPGDNILVDFPSAVEAVNSAVELQKIIEGRNLELPPDRRMQFRVGVNLGDVIEEDDGSIYGDGVNIAARMESLAEPGGICISSTVYDAVQGKIDFGFDFLGDQQVKNIPRPIAVYRVRAEKPVAPPVLSRMPWKVGLAGIVGLLVVLVGIVGWHLSRDKPSDRAATPSSDATLQPSTGPVVAVLPFHNLSGDPEQDYFAQGVSEDMLNQLSLAPGIQVIGRSSSFRYRDPKVDSSQAGKELGAQFLVVGSVRRAEGKVRVSAELIDVATAKVVWSNAYNRKLTTTELFAVQDDVTRSIVAAIADEYGVISQLTRRRTQGSEASLGSYECVLRAYHFFEYFTEANHLRARDCLEEAVKRDPQYAEAWGWLAILYAIEHTWKFNLREDPLGRALRAGNTAVAADRNSQMAWEGKAAAHHYRGEWDEFHAAAQKTISLNPNHVSTIGNMAWYYANFGDYNRAMPLVDHAIALSPFPPFWFFHVHWHKYYADGNFESALEYAKKGKQEGFWFCYLTLAATYAELGDKAQAATNVQKLLETKPDFAKTYVAWAKSLNYPRERIAEIAASLKKAGLATPDDVVAGEPERRGWVPHAHADGSLQGTELPRPGWSLNTRRPHGRVNPVGFVLAHSFDP
jgi:adenylate cyclase